MEIEAKFVVPDRQVYAQLGRLRSLAGYGLTPAGVAAVSDRYFDTLDRRFLAAGYACRLRQEGDALLLTLKGLGGVEGAVHRRDEREVALPAWNPDPTAWPESAARVLALELAKDAPLRPLFGLRQRRRRAEVTQGGRRVAELSLDAVRVTVGRQPVSYFELEVELKGDGAEADLAALAAELAGAWGLVPEPRAKFERALALVDASADGAGLRLSPAERAALEVHAAGADLLARRAQVVLLWAGGQPTGEIALRTGLSVGRVRFWLREFRKERLGIFGAGADHAAGGAADKQVPRTLIPLSNTALAGLPTITEFCRAYGVDLRHARFVAGEALALFNALKPAHRLPKKRRKLLRQAALLCNIGAASDPEHPHAAGRDLILAQPLRDISTTDRLALACIVAFQREKVKPERESTLAALEEKLQAQVLALAALLQMAEALDFSRSRATMVQAVEGADGPRAELTVGGPQADVDARQAAARGGLWYQLFKQEIVFTTVEAELAAAIIRMPDLLPADVSPVLPPSTPTPEPPAVPPMLPDEAMSEAGRKAMYTHFLKMLANEPGTRLGEDIEFLHDMRVSTRRMRAAYRIFADHYDQKTLAPFNKGLRRTGAVLGAVRDLDVLLEKAEAWGASPPADPAAEQQPASEEGGAPTAQPSHLLEPLLTDWRTQREVARRQMLEYLDSAAYRRFVADFEVFLTTPGAGALPVEAGAPTPYQVRHIVPRLIFTRYEAVRAYEPILDGAPLTTYHALRIDFKRLRYALEFFREVLGPETPGLIKATVSMQDLLGALQDAYVAEGLIGEFLAAQKAKRKKRYAAGELADVEAYLAAQRAAQHELVAGFPALWAEIVGPDFRRTLALAVAAL